jgi:hypothetical protein
MDSRHILLATSTRTSGVRSVRMTLALSLVAALGACSSNDLPSATSTLAASAPTAQAIAADRQVAGSLKQAERDALKLANAAYQANRIVSPPGDNALEHALRARDANANSQGAAELLTDITPMVTSQVQTMIAERQLDEAARVITLLQQSNPNSLTTLSLNRQLGNVMRSTSIAAVASNTR